MVEDAEEPRWAHGLAKPPAWTADAGRPVYANSWIQVIEHQATAPSGAACLYGVVRFATRAVGVFPLHEDGTVSLVGQQRFALRNYSWEMPEGGVPLDEALEDGARRELREETGLAAAELRRILDLELSNSITDERAVCFLATGLTPGAVDPDETEVIQLARVPFRALLAEVTAGRVRDVMTVAATLRVHHMAVAGELSPDLSQAVLRG